MRITTFADDSQGDAGGYEDRLSVALYFTPAEAHDLRVVLDDVIAGGNTREPGWHTHVQAWDESAEIVVFFDHDGADKEPRPRTSIRGSNNLQPTVRASPSPCER